MHPRGVAAAPEMVRIPLAILLAASLLCTLPIVSADSTILLYDTSVNFTYTTDGTYLYGTVVHDYQAWVAIGWHEAGVFPSQGAMYSRRRTCFPDLPVGTHAIT